MGVFFTDTDAFHTLDVAPEMYKNNLFTLKKSVNGSTKVVPDNGLLRSLFYHTKFKRKRRSKKEDYRSAG